MNYINQLQAENTALRAQLEIVRAETSSFRTFLNSPKFVGTEANGERKDWIATADVIAWLRELANKIA